MSITNLHPMLVHLPIALLSTSLLFDLIGYVTGRADLVRAGWWTLLVGFVGLVASIISGLVAKGTVLIPQVAQEHFETHEQMAFLVAVLYTVAILWRAANRSSLPKGKEWAFTLFSFVGVLLIWATAWFGGELVFRFGIGVSAK